MAEVFPPLPLASATAKKITFGRPLAAAAIATACAVSVPARRLVAQRRRRRSIAVLATTVYSSSTATV